MSLGTFHMRIKTEDTRSESATPLIYHTFDVNFSYECQSDYFTLSGKSEQSFQIGSGNVAISLGMWQAVSNCYKTVEHLYWNNSTSNWEAFSGANSYRGQADNSITIGVSSSYYNNYRPEVYYDIKVIWTSAYSTRSDGVVEEQF